MADWIETFRGTVAPWECDITEHFTIAYYLDRLDQASATLADHLGTGERVRTGVFPRRFTLRFVRELRAGASFHVESAPIGLDRALHIGHRFVDSASAAPLTWVREVWETEHLVEAEQNAVREAMALWDGPDAEERTEPSSMAGLAVSARSRVRPADLDEFGHFSLAAFVHRFTDALIQATAAIGMTAEYMNAERRGYSTFELGLRISGAPRLGDRLVIKTGIAHLGNSSIRFLHRMFDPRSGHEFACLAQGGVQLDLDARRPAPLPPEIRAAAARLLLDAD